MGLLHIGQTQRTSSHFTRHLWAEDNASWFRLSQRAQLLLGTSLSLPPPNPSGLPGVLTGCRASLDNACPTADTYFR